jgi:ubiquitin C-terminal hydrolase
MNCSCAGKSPARGHYVTRVRQPEGYWLEYDDTKVSVLPMRAVFDRQAYVLLYERVA